jgi:hypothetical protein
LIASFDDSITFFEIFKFSMLLSCIFYWKRESYTVKHYYSKDQEKIFEIH